MKRLTAIIFDLDGTLVDSSPAIVECMNYALAAKGFPPADPYAVKREIGTPLEDMFSSLTDDDPSELVLRYRERYNEVFLQKTQLLPGAKKALQTLKDRGYRLAVATAKPRYFTEPILEHLGVGPLFEAVAGAEEVACLKPCPDILHLVLSRLGSREDETLYVGDHPVDVAAGHAARIEVISVTTGFHSREELEKLHPAAVVEDLRELVSFLPDDAGNPVSLRKRGRRKGNSTPVDDSIS
jgi:phosphoglycolate phosphatase